MDNLQDDKMIASDDEPTTTSTFEQNFITLGFLIPLSVLGLIIGKKGQRMKSDFTEVEIFIQRFSDTPADSKERVVFLTGNFKSVVNAQEIMLNIVKNKRPNFDRINSDCHEVRIGDNEVLFRGVITGRLTGLLIGKSGANIKAIRDATGCWVKIGHEEERLREFDMINKRPQIKILRQIYIQGPPENVAKARLLVAAKVPIHTASSTNMVHYYPLSFSIAESLRYKNCTLLQDINKASGALVELLPLDAFETGENMTHIVIRGEKEANEIAKNLLDSYLIEWESTQVATDIQSNNSASSYNNNDKNCNIEEIIVLRWCLPSEIVFFLFDNIITIEYIQKVSNIILHVLFDRPSISLTSHDTVLVMIGKLTNIVKAEHIILTKIFEIEHGPPSLLQLKNKLFKPNKISVDVSSDDDDQTLITSTTTTNTTTSPTFSHPPSEPSPTDMMASTRSLKTSKSLESYVSKRESKIVPQSFTPRRYSSKDEYKSNNKVNDVDSNRRSIMGVGRPVLYAENDMSIISSPLESILQSHRNLPTSTSSLSVTHHLQSTSTKTGTGTTIACSKHKCHSKVKTRRCTTNSENSKNEEMLEVKSTTSTSTTATSVSAHPLVVDKVPMLTALTSFSAPVLFPNSLGMSVPSGYCCNYTPQQQQQIQYEFFYRQEQERQQFLYWQSQQQRQQHHHPLQLQHPVAYLPYSYGLPQHHQYIPSTFPYHPSLGNSPQSLGRGQSHITNSNYYPTQTVPLLSVPISSASGEVVAAQVVAGDNEKQQHLVMPRRTSFLAESNDTSNNTKETK